MCEITNEIGHWAVDFRLQDAEASAAGDNGSTFVERSAGHGADRCPFQAVMT